MPTYPTSYRHEDTFLGYDSSHKDKYMVLLFYKQFYSDKIDKIKNTLQI